MSIGYFGAVRDVARVIREGEAQIVRRPTGGGVVDHRIDRTYTLVVPKEHALARTRGGESYRVIHEALAEAMHAAEIEARLIDRDAEIDSPACFEKPVAWDIVDERGRKLAGAGQRRTRRGLLHQGSVVLSAETPALFDDFARLLAGEVEPVGREPSREELAAGVGKFSSAKWFDRR